MRTKIIFTHTSYCLHLHDFIIPNLSVPGNCYPRRYNLQITFLLIPNILQKIHKLKAKHK